MSKLPLKFRVFQIIAQQQDVSNLELLTMLQSEYPNERYAQQAEIDKYLMSLKAVGLIELSGALLTDTGTLVQQYRITASGTSKLKYLD